MRTYKTCEMIGYNPKIDRIIDNTFDKRIMPTYNAIINGKLREAKTIEIFRTLNFRCFENPITLRRYYLHA